MRPSLDHHPIFASREWKIFQCNVNPVIIIIHIIVLCPNKIHHKRSYVKSNNKTVKLHLFIGGRPKLVLIS